MMSGNTQLKQIATLCALWFLTLAIGSAATSGRLSSRFLARGEQALLEIATTKPLGRDYLPQIPTLEEIKITPYGRGSRTRLLAGRRIEYVSEFLVSSYATGNHVIPSIDVIVDGNKTRTEPIEFTVFNPDDLQWAEATAGTTKFRYASIFRILNQSPYDGETTPVEIKLFVPRDLFVADWGIPHSEHDGVTAWRFQPSAMLGRINLLGMPYVSVAYPSTLRAIRSGSVGIGPAKIRLMITQVVMDGIMRRESVETFLTIPKLGFVAKKLPEGAPKGFVNAVGSFRLSVSSSLTESQEGDPIPLEIVVSGTGNLDALRPPTPIDTQGWKVYEPTTEQRGDERRQLSGSVVFHQFMRPLEVKATVPPFRLVYFDPKLRTYKTLATEAIPLKMTPMAATAPGGLVAPPQAKSVPLERMTDILAILRSAPLIDTATSAIPRWLGHLVAALLALALIAKALWMRNHHRFQKDPVKTTRMADLRKVERMKNDDDIGFLMSAGRFIERWLGDNPSPDVLAVLAERDAACFLKEKPGNSLLKPRQRNGILKVLRKAAMVGLFGTLLGLGSGRAQADDLSQRALDAYDSALYEEAIGLWLQAGRYEELSADALYNIGNACYRAGSPGYAALFYRRALTRDATHQESSQNLRFIERKHGALTVHRAEFQDTLTYLSLSSWKAILWAGLWLCLLAVLVFPATRPDARLRVTAIVALVIGPLLAASGALGWHYFPDDAEFTPLARQAVIISDNAVLHSDASRTSPEVIDAPPGSLCELIKQSGEWSYIAFATKTRGWIPTRSIERVVPESTPHPPKIRKPKADEKNA